MKKLLLTLAALLGFASAFAGSGTDASPYTVAEVIAKGVDLNEKGVYVQGYIVGTVAGSTWDKASIGLKDAINTNLLLASSATETDENNCIPVALPKGSVRDELNLVDHAGNLGKEIVLNGDLIKYFSVPGLKNVKSYRWAGDAPVDPDPTPDPTVESVKSIAEFVAKTSEATPYPVVTIDAPVTVAYQNLPYTYITDAAGDFLLIYGKEVPAYLDGDVIPAGITGNAQMRYGAPQMSSPDATTFKAATAGTPVQPEQLLVEDIAADMIHQYVLLKGVSIAEGAKANNYTISDASGEITLYNQFNNPANVEEVVTVATGTNLTVYGFIGTYNGNAQIYATKVISASGLEAVATPYISPAAGEVAEGTKVTITCATEGATIYYTLDGSQPNASSSVYTEAIVINEATTVKAIAVKDGMADSSVATATYTIKEPEVIDGTYVTYDFTKPQDITATPALDFETEPAKDGSITILVAETDDTPAVSFTAGPISLQVNKGGHAQGGAVFFSTKAAWSLRIYKKALLTIAAAEGVNITGINFEYENTNSETAMTQCAFSAGTYAAGKWTGKATSVEIDGANNTKSTIAIKTVTVIYEGTTGCADIEIDDANAPVEYYNLQGIRVAEPTNGLYIRRQGNNTSNVVIR